MEKLAKKRAKDWNKQQGIDHEMWFDPKEDFDWISSGSKPQYFSLSHVGILRGILIYPIFFFIMNNVDINIK